MAFQTPEPDPVVDPTRISQACSEGRHNRCRGKVYVYPPVKVKNRDQRWIVCECPTPDCGHGPDGI